MWGVRVAGSQDVLFTNFDLAASCSFDIGVQVRVR
jgi:hypothetical protein